MKKKDTGTKFSGGGGPSPTRVAWNTDQYFVENSDALTEAEKVQFAGDLLELERQGVLEYRDGRWGLAAGVEIEETPEGPVARFRNKEEASSSWSQEF
jgi:hypothetical protein